MKRVTQRARRSRVEGQIGLEEVASLANVSIASVSRVLNGKTTVADDIRQRVEEACAKLGYLPNGAARALSTQRTKAIGAVVPSIENGGFARVIAALQERLRIAGYNLILAGSGYEQRLEYEAAAALLSQGVDGLVLVGSQHDERLMPLLERRGIIFVETWILGNERPCVGFDNALAARRVVKYLLDLGHVKISVITGRTSFNDRAAARVRGVEDELKANDLKLHSHLVVDQPYRIQDGRIATRSLLETDNPPSAIVCGNDQLAFGAIIESKFRGLSIPRDISITGFNDADYAPHLDPPLTTINVPSEEMGTRAAEYLIKKLNGEIAMAAWEVDVNLVVRGSTGAPPSKR
ncbi:LacI family DNA-binding transcriptional regulator [Agrobacterium rhizogenes]|uniref:LacI family DNA-binding transcriptional regulator n=1 Tax=Rhizobium rhizogenes TaxID=359 RepID=UPI0022B669F1|nr:LacI family DNA-binding transcriptional regulator [Rhizobium rhizogenes]MCZ7447271.1 LacI family DNA-binding transcriptional regulator [Rhizobium rhizogenes]